MPCLRRPSPARSAVRRLALRKYSVPGIDNAAHSGLLRDVLDYHEKREQKQNANEIAERLIQAGFAERSKSKAGKGVGIVTEVGPVVAQSVLNFFASAAGKKILQRLKQL